MSHPGRTNRGLEELLTLDGVDLVLERRYWVSFRAWLVVPEESIPHGLRYSLSLHDRYGQRIIGFDNAHVAKPRKRRFEPKETLRDHWHQGDETLVYTFESPAKLMVDFWKQVEQSLDRHES